MMPYLPLGTLYAAAYLRMRGHDVSLFDSMLSDSEGEIAGAIARHRPSIVVIYDDDFNYLTKMCLRRMREAAFAMCSIAKEQGCTVVVHGSDPADQADQYLRNGADYVVVGEGEITLGELVDRIDGRTDTAWSDIAGLAMVHDGTVKRTPRREALEDLDLLPFPARDLADVERYRTAWKKRHGYFSMNIVTTRGCPFHCNWCAKPLYGQVYHSRSPENVVDEMEFIKKEYAPDHLWFCDDIFGLKPGWVPRFADAVTARKAEVPFKCLSRADLLLKERSVEQLARAGCTTVWIGAESGSQKILDAMEKGTTVEQIYRSSTLLRQHRIRVGFFLQFGYPGETREDIEKTLEMVHACKPDDIGISVSYPLPGTKFHEMVEQELGEKKNWIDSQDLALMYRGTFSPDYYRMLHKVTHKKFRIWQGKDIWKALARHPQRADKHSFRRMAAAAYHAATLPRLQAKLDRLERAQPPH